jgi:preprotein translocase subunit SecF
MFVIKYRKIWFALSAILLAVSIGAIVVYGFKPSIDFRGGTITEVRFNERPAQTDVEAKLNALNLGGYSLRPSGQSNYTIRSRELSTGEKQTLTQALGNPVVERQNTIGPIAGAELRSKAVKAVVVVVLMIVLFVTFAFRGVSRPVSSWKYGLATIIALFHDVIIPTGIFVILGHFLGIEIDLLFVTGLLAILGYSVHDTIVVFDRVRENLRLNEMSNRKEPFEDTVGKAVAQTFGRSINTSLTIFITLLALYLFGGASVHYFALLLIIGVIIGTYSSIFVASPLLVTFYKLQNNK